MHLLSTTEVARADRRASGRRASGQFISQGLMHVVLLALAFASIVCWAIIVQKMRLLQKARRDNANFLHVFRTSNDLAFIAAAARRFAALPPAVNGTLCGSSQGIFAGHPRWFG
jgi:hypothetical protein